MSTKLFMEGSARIEACEWEYKISADDQLEITGNSVIGDKVIFMKWESVDILIAFLENLKRDREAMKKVVLDFKKRERKNKK